MTYRLVYDAGQIPLAASFWPAAALALAGLGVLAWGIWRLGRPTRSWRQRNGLVIFVLVCGALPCLLGGAALKEVYALWRHRQDLRAALARQTFPAAEGRAIFKVSPRYPGSLERNVLARVGDKTFFFRDPSSRDGVQFYGVAVQGSPQLRVTYVPGPGFPEVLRVEIAGP